MKKNLILIYVFFLMPFLIGCSQKRIYQNIQINKSAFEKGFVNSYYFKNNMNINNDTLIIYIDGSGPVSVLGRRYFSFWTSVTISYFMQQNLKNDYDLLIPEKPDTKLGKIQRKNYRNKKYRVSGCTEAINSFLEENEYNNCYLIGLSEGGDLAPMIYSKIKKRENIKGLVLIASGALSLYECFKVQKNKTSLPFHYQSSLNRIKKLLAKKNKSEGEKIWLNYYTSSSIEELKKIDVPILLMHGEKDTNCPVESSRFVVDEFNKIGKINLLYKEYQGLDHGFDGKIDLVISDIKDWINKLNKS